MAEGVEAQLARLDERMNRVEEGVANFRAFQVDMRQFVTTFNQREADRRITEEHQTKRSDRRWTAMLVIGTLMGTAIAGLVAIRGWEDAHLAVPSAVLSAPQNPGYHK